LVYSDFAENLLHYGRKGAIEHIDFSEIPKSILLGIGCCADIKKNTGTKVNLSINASHQ